jgi:hypothetical protein
MKERPSATKACGVCGGPLPAVRSYTMQYCLVCAPAKKAESLSRANTKYLSQEDKRAARAVVLERYWQKNKEKLRIKRFFTEYGLTEDAFFEMLRSQDGRCAICRIELQAGKFMHIDHDHVTQKVRGILCHKCNKGLGHFQDDVAVMQAAIEYLRRNV